MNPFEGEFDKLDEDEKTHCMEIASWFHYRDGRRSDDGSMGSVRISYKQLLDALAKSKNEP